MNKPLHGQAPTEEDNFYLEWGRETIKKNIEISQNVLTQLLTLNTALMGSSVIFLGENIMGKPYQVAASSCFFIGLTISFFGIFPHASKVSVISPSQIKIHKGHALERKCKYMWFAGAFTGAGLIVAAVGAMCA